MLHYYSEQALARITYTFFWGISLSTYDICSCVARRWPLPDGMVPVPCSVLVLVNDRIIFMYTDTVYMYIYCTEHFILCYTSAGLCGSHVVIFAHYLHPTPKGNEYRLCIVSPNP